jgi:predicted 3-demethylubiquinone-9 3-methyltransferase (glyoxalase superfamily)
MIECGWLEDKFGISWQVVPKCLVEYLEKGDQEQKERVTEAFMGMKKLEIEGIKKAYAGA